MSKTYTINEKEYEVGKIEFQQNVELMKYISDHTKELSISVEQSDQGVGINFTKLFNDIVNNQIVGKIIAFMIKEKDQKWNPDQIDDVLFCHGVEALYEDDLMEIWDAFWIKKKALIPAIPIFSSLAATLMKK